METFLVLVLTAPSESVTCNPTVLTPASGTRPSPISPTASSNTPSPSKSHWYPERAIWPSGSRGRRGEGDALVDPRGGGLEDESSAGPRVDAHADRGFADVALAVGDAQPDRDRARLGVGPRGRGVGAGVELEVAVAVEVPLIDRDRAAGFVPGGAGSVEHDRLGNTGGVGADGERCDGRNEGLRIRRGREGERRDRRTPAAPTAIRIELLCVASHPVPSAFRLASRLRARLSSARRTASRADFIPGPVVAGRRRAQPPVCDRSARAGP